MEKLTMTLKEAAVVVGVSEPTMRIMAQQDGFPAMRLGARWIISRTALNDWLVSAANNRVVMEGRTGKA